MNRRHVTLITTGGSIDKIYPPDQGSYAFVFAKKSAALHIAKRAGIPFPQAYALPPRDSLDIDDAYRESIALECAKAVEAVLITHGTDTMVQTAAFLASRNFPLRIVLTGSSYPESVKESDADFNFGFAYCAAQMVPEHGVYIAMSGELFRWDECKKISSGHFIRI
jgi:L-asparaginase